MSNSLVEMIIAIIVVRKYSMAKKSLVNMFQTTDANRGNFDPVVFDIKAYSTQIMTRFCDLRQIRCQNHNSQNDSIFISLAN